jgi:hypothetical protein
MRTLYALGAIAGFGLAAAAMSPNARAGDWSVGFTVGGPGYVVVTPPPAYVPPPTYYVAPPYRYGPSYYYSPPRYYYAPRERYERDHDWYRRQEWREWHYRHHHDDDD